MHLRLLTLFLIAVGALQAQRVTLYLKGGGDMLVREYEVQEDRVRYYSLERSQWEEIPLELVDLEKTKQTAERAEKRRESMRRESAAERAAEAKATTELHNVPVEDGIYHYLDGKTTPLEQREVLIDKSTKRGILQKIAPVPIVAGKQTRFIEGAASKVVVGEDKPIFFVRDPSLTHFLMVKLTPDKNSRVVQIVQVIPVSKELVEEQNEIELFRQEYAYGVYRVWPVKPIEPGEYALIDYTPGTDNLRVWDFAYQPSGAAAAGERPTQP
jgi:hypothetical protein